MMLQDDTTAYSVLTRTTTTIATTTIIAITVITAITATARQLPAHYRHHLVKSSFTILLSHACLDLYPFRQDSADDICPLSVFFSERAASVGWSGGQVCGPSR